eukprot:15463542-Alexandrium_andersonii.AAC.1
MPGAFAETRGRSNARFSPDRRLNKVYFNVIEHIPRHPDDAPLYGLLCHAASKGKWKASSGVRRSSG